MGSAPFALFQPVIHAQYSAERIRRRPRVPMLTSTEFYGNWRAKVPNILREAAKSFRFLNAE
jgi:hypothetical protein